MTPDQLRAIRKKRGLSCRKMAEYLGLKSTRTVQYYESGERPIPGTVVRILQLTDDWRPPQDNYLPPPSGWLDIYYPVGTFYCAREEFEIEKFLGGKWVWQDCAATGVVYRRIA